MQQQENKAETDGLKGIKNGRSAELLSLELCSSHTLHGTRGSSMQICLVAFYKIPINLK
jgi:hypothetical protein